MLSGFASTLFTLAHFASYTSGQVLFSSSHIVPCAGRQLSQLCFYLFYPDYATAYHSIMRLLTIFTVLAPIALAVPLNRRQMGVTDVYVFLLD
jgi:hypothetical protein